MPAVTPGFDVGTPRFLERSRILVKDEKHLNESIPRRQRLQGEQSSTVILRKLIWLPCESKLNPSKEQPVLTEKNGFVGFKEGLRTTSESRDTLDLDAQAKGYSKD